MKGLSTRHLAVLLVLASGACELGKSPGSYATRVTSPRQLIGGPGALGGVGDWLLANDEVHFVIQDQGWSRGFGIFGGGIIDADLVRPGTRGTGDRGNGRDNFGEFFPMLFLQAFDVADQNYVDGVTRKAVKLPGIEIIADGSDGGAAIIRTRASGGNFLTMVSLVLDFAMPGSALRFETDYILHPGARHVEIIGRLRNVGSSELDLSGEGLGSLLAAIGIDSNLQLPLGDVSLFGEGNLVFAPGAIEKRDADGVPTGDMKPMGFDLRYSVEEAYRVPRELPALPGLVTDFLATAGDGVSYGYAAGKSPTNYVWANRQQYERDAQADVSDHAMLVPFLVSSFTGAFYQLPPSTLGTGEIFEYKKYFLVGDGDVASIRDELHKIRETPVGHFQGEVRFEHTREPAHGAWVHLLDSNGRPHSQIEVEADGNFRCSVPVGAYSYIVTAEGIYPTSEGATSETATQAGSFAVAEVGQSVRRNIVIPLPGRLVVSVRDSKGRELPAKVTVVAPYKVSAACVACDVDCDQVCAPRNFLFDLSLGEHRRHTDLNWKKKRGSRDGEFIEEVLFAGADGTAVGTVRPNCRPGGVCRTYDVYVSRGPEYDLHIERGVTIEAGRVTRLSATLARVVDTQDYIGVDMHVHSAGSVDSSVTLRDRVVSGAAEGLEVMVSTDHNYISDFAPAIVHEGLQDWMTSVVGVELSTLEMGHFNGFPIRLDKSVPSQFPYVETCFNNREFKVNRTSFDWVECAPQQMFDNLRKLGGGDRSNTIVQVNHPRDSILGYFNQYYLNPYTAIPDVPKGDNYPLVEFIAPRNTRTQQFDPAKFSYDFDAVEVFNGKRLDALHTFHVPQDAPESYIAEITDTACGEGHQDNGPGQPLLREGGHITAPGAVDDWLHLLNRCLPRNCRSDEQCGGILQCVDSSCVNPRVGDPSGGLRCPMASGNSDTHSLSAEVGSPRTYLKMPPGSDGQSGDTWPGRVKGADLVRAIRGSEAVITNGPFLTMSVVTRSSAFGDQEPVAQTWNVGSTVFYASSNVGRDVEVLFRVQSAAWVAVDRIRVFANGEHLDTIELPKGLNAQGRSVDDDALFKRRYVFNKDTVIVAEALGDDSLFPIVTSEEQAPANITEVLSALVGSLGDGAGSNDGLGGPDIVQPVTAYALTNPIFIDVNASGTFDPPGNSTGPGEAQAPAMTACTVGVDSCPDGQFCNGSLVPIRCDCMQTNSLKRARNAAAVNLAPPRAGGQHYPRWDIRRVFAPHRHAH